MPLRKNLKRKDLKKGITPKAQGYGAKMNAIAQQPPENTPQKTILPQTESDGEKT